MLMLLGISIILCVALAILGSHYGREVITNETISQLKLVRYSKKERVKTYFQGIQDFVELLAQNDDLIEAADNIGKAYKDVEVDTLLPSINNKLENYYQTFVNQLSKNLEITKDHNLYIPYTDKGKYLQYHYLQNFSYKNNLSDSLHTDFTNSNFYKIHEKFHHTFNVYVDKNIFYDAFLVDLDKGDVMYSVKKEVDFATNLYTGPYSGSNLAQLAKSLKTDSDIKIAKFQDFAPYRPSYGAPAAFVGIPLIKDSRIIAGLIFQVPIDQLNDLMTNKGNWERDGLGKTGETFLVGADKLMRSDSRFFIQDSINFAEDLKNNDISQETIDKIYKYGTTVLQLHIDSDNIDRAIKGNDGYLNTTGYRGEKVLSTYAPVQIGDLNWVIIAEKDYDEFMLPVRDFNKRLLIQTIILIILVTLFALWLSKHFVKPIEDLSEAAAKVIKGESDHKILIKRKDEFGQLANSFNSMISSIHVQKKALEEQSAFNDSLLNNFIPEEFKNRLQQGEKAFAQNNTNLTLILIDIAGFSDLLTTLGPDQSVKILSDIMEALDNAGSALKIERIKTIGDSYFAACGLFDPRLDHTNRSVSYAEDAQQLLKEINRTHNLNLQVQISLTNGDVIAGIIGNENFSFDIWGPTVSTLFNLNALEADGSIIMTANVKERLDSLYEFKEFPETLKNGRTVFELKNKK